MMARSGFEPVPATIHSIIKCFMLHLFELNCYGMSLSVLIQHHTILHRSCLNCAQGYEQLSISSHILLFTRHPVILSPLFHFREVFCHPLDECNASMEITASPYRIRCRGDRNRLVGSLTICFLATHGSNLRLPVLTAVDCIRELFAFQFYPSAIYMLPDGRWLYFLLY